MNVTSLDEARVLLAKLPLDQAKLMEFDLIEVGPLSPLHLTMIGFGTRTRLHRQSPSEVV